VSERALRLPRLVIAGSASGVGKTTVMLALTRALTARGLRVATFKCGPDYLDPTYHARAAGGRCHNLDGWMMGRDAVQRTFASAAEGSDLALIEGVMGLFDGASPTSDEGSSAEIAKWLAAPVLLTVDAGGMARSVAALAQGFRDFDPELWLAGLVCNRVGSKGHLELLRRALPTLPLLGGLPRAPRLTFEERHLGLHSADARVLPDATLDAWRALAEEWFDLDALVALARSAPPLPAPIAGRPQEPAPRCRIGVAFDDAFHFYYDDNLRQLEGLGAELVRFSPLAEAALPEVDGLYFGGGYPELFASALSENEALRVALVDFAARGGPIYAECGGLMYLAGGIQTLDGSVHPMVGLLPGVARVHDRLQALGYVEVRTRRPSILGAAGLEFRGHQFRYSELVDAAQGERAYELSRRRDGEQTLEGYASGSVLGSYVHAHWASNPRVAGGFVESCSDFARRQAPAHAGVASAARAWKGDA
jgi:cobyrinic acid a,c-diamide synthase